MNSIRFALLLPILLTACQSVDKTETASLTPEDRKNYCFDAGKRHSIGTPLRGKVCNRPAHMDILNPPPPIWE